MQKKRELKIHQCLTVSLNDFLEKHENVDKSNQYDILVLEWANNHRNLFAVFKDRKCFNN